MKSSFLRICLVVLVTLPVHVGSLGRSCLASPPGSGEVHDTIQVVGNGEAAIVNDDLTRARQEALDMAMKDAFENALAQAVPESLSIRVQRDLLRELTPKMNRFLVRYRFEEMPVAGDIFITVEAAYSRSRFQEEFKKSGLFVGQQETDAKPATIYLSIRGISDARIYNVVVEGLPKRIERIKRMVPYEIFGKELVLKILYEGTEETFREKVRDSLQEMLPPRLPSGERLDVLVSSTPPSSVSEQSSPEGKNASQKK